MRWGGGSHQMALLIAAVPCLLLGVQAKELSIEMEHSLDGLTFSKAGYLQGSLFDSDFGRGEALTLNRMDLSEKDQDLLADLVRQKRVYRVRLPSDASDVTSPKISTSIPASCLISSGMQDHLQVHAAPNGKFVGVNYDFASHPCLPEADVQVPSELRFPESSSIPVWMPVTAPVLTKAQSTFAPGTRAKSAGPQGQAGPKQGGGQGDKEETPVDTRPWILKNWMIALPLAFVAMNVLGALMGPQEAGGAPAAASPAARRR